MDPSSAQLHRQEMNSQTLESMLVCTKTQQDQKKPRPPEQAVKCPRCESTNTKFCYYNNYSLSQPRYFCKSCRRYWTKGGTLRNVPVGGGCRKNKRSSSSSSSSKRSQDQPLTTNPSPLSPLTLSSYDSNDLALAFARLQKQTTGQLGFDDLSLLGNPSNYNCDIIGNTTTAGFFDAMRGGLNTLEAPNAFYNVHYGINDGNNRGHVENSGMGLNVGEEIGISYDDVSAAGATTTATTVTTVKQESCNVGRESENRVLWSFPWQVGGDGNMSADLDSGRHSWNGFGSSWHGLLNSPLL